MYVGEPPVDQKWLIIIVMELGHRELHAYKSKTIPFIKATELFGNQEATKKEKKKKQQLLKVEEKCHIYVYNYIYMI